MPRWSVITAVFDPSPDHLEACLASVREQTETDLEHIVVDDCSTAPHVADILQRAARRDARLKVVSRETNGGIVAASRDALAAATGEFVALLDHDDVLEPDALASMGAALADGADGHGADVAYSDHDLLLPDGRTGPPYFKPDFSPEQLRNQNYVLHFVAARRALVEEVGGFRPGFDGAQDHDLLLRLSERTDRIAHVPRILYHWRQAPASVASNAANKPWAFEAGRRAVQDHCDRTGVDAVVEAGPAPGTYRVDRRLPPDAPRVSVVIPTRGGSRPVWGVERCFVVEAVQSLVEHASYPDLEYVVVYDDVTPESVLAALRSLAGDRLALVRYDEPFNFSHKINLGVAASSGEMVLLLNDDTELIEPDSIETMVAHLLAPGPGGGEVGLVGPKLLFADGTIQDGGHVYNHHPLPGLVGWPGDGPGPWQLRPLAVAREVSGVTAAVALVGRDVFDEVGGYDESMPVNFNDVDFALKIRATGRRVIWTPHACWYHFESQTRPPTATPEEFARLESRWRHELRNDPYYSPNLATHRSDWLEPPLMSGEPTVEVGAGRSRATRLRLGALAIALVALVGVATTTSGGELTAGSRILFTWFPLLVVIALAAVAAFRGRWVLAASALAALMPSTIAQLAASRTPMFGLAVAVAVAVGLGPLAHRSRRLAFAVAGGATAVGLVGGWRTTPNWFDRSGATWGEAIGSAGRHIGDAVGSLAPIGGSASVTASLVWWVAAGMVIASAVASRRWPVALAPVLAAAIVTVFAVAIDVRGRAVNASNISWLISGSVVFVGSRVQLGKRAERRIAAAAVMLLAWAWTQTVVGLTRYSAADPGAGDDSAPPAWSRWSEWYSLVGGPSPVVAIAVAAAAGLVVAGVGWSLVGPSRDRRGVNVVGYHSITAGLGERTRELTESLRAAGVPVAAYDLAVESAREGERLPTPDERYDTTVVVTPAFEVGQAARTHPSLFEGRRLVAGYWFWELDEIPDSHRAGIDLVDEVWAPTRFVHDAYADVADRPVRHLPLAIGEPEVASLGRVDLGLGGNDFVVLVSFSHLSVMERKNPLGAIEAFRRAFPRTGRPDTGNGDGDGGRARLVIKTINADLKPDDAQRLRDAAAGDPRIEVRDGRVDHAELMALVQASDVFLSLHRSEGLGLQIADAMWLGTPVVATDHGGSTDLVDATCAEVIPAGRTLVRDGDGAYPGTMAWADPDLDAAAAALRRLATDPDHAARLATEARRRIATAPDRMAAGRAIAKLARCPSRP